MIKGLKDGDWIWCFICGQESLVGFISAYGGSRRWGYGFQSYPVCTHCENANRYSHSIGKVHDPVYEREVTIP